jgi:SpoVK/Ycf46/Vps4 family AAA+-type ATPase
MFLIHKCLYKSALGTTMAGEPSKMVAVTEFVNPVTSFDDVAGLEEVKNTLRRIALPPWGSVEKPAFDVVSNTLSILLNGPLGTGKALLGAAIAKESGARFISIDFANLLFGCHCWTNRNNIDDVKALFSEAEKNKPSVIFFEGIDTISQHTASWEMGAFNQLLKELDIPRNEVMIIASATKLEEIPWVLFRRFWYRLEVTLPDDVARRDIMKNLLKNYGANPKEPKVVEIENVTAVIEVLAKISEGFSGEEIFAVCQNTVLHALGEFFDCHEKIILKPFNFEIELENVKQARNKKLADHNY